MSQSPKIPRKQAEAIAREIHLQLGPHCEKFTFAGSLRRLCPEVGDIEAVVLPKMMEVEDTLFTTTRVRSREFVMAVMNIGTVIVGDPLVARYVRMNVGGKLLNPEAKAKDFKFNGGIQFDLFIPKPENYGFRLALSTGSDRFCKGVLAPRWVSLGWCGVDGDLRRRSQCTDFGKDNKRDWRLNGGLSHVDLPPDFGDERSFFEFLGLAWVEPKDRNY